MDTHTALWCTGGAHSHRFQPIFHHFPGNDIDSIFVYNTHNFYNSSTSYRTVERLELNFFDVVLNGTSTHVLFAYRDMIYVMVFAPWWSSLILSIQSQLTHRKALDAVT